MWGEEERIRDEAKAVGLQDREERDVVDRYDKSGRKGGFGWKDQFSLGHVLVFLKKKRTMYVLKVHV